jgi:hypothetical protein
MFLRREGLGNTYELLAAGSSQESLGTTLNQIPRWPKTRTTLRYLIPILGLLFIAGAGFTLGVLATRPSVEREAAENAAATIPLRFILREFIYSTAFSEEPPRGETAGNMSEPVWDSLIPSMSLRSLLVALSLTFLKDGLGYFKDAQLAPTTSIPTVFHQLHCLYTLRRAYYSSSGDLQEFDFGKERSSHVAHCFDYLQQGLTCLADTTVEPAIDEKNGFLGSGIQRKCRDYEALKDFVEQRRVFNASGFLAQGIEHGHVKVDGS